MNELFMDYEGKTLHFPECSILFMTKPVLGLMKSCNSKSNSGVIFCGAFLSISISAALPGNPKPCDIDPTGLIHPAVTSDNAS